MCISPIKIRNPHYINPHAGLHSNLQSLISQNDSRFHNTTDFYIEVPCHNCPECVRLKQLYFVQRAELEAMHSYVYFQTLTYKDSMLPKLFVDFPDNPAEISFADFHDIQNYFKSLRNHKIFGNRRFKYLVVSERGGKHHRPHWHILYFVEQLPEDNEFTPLNLEKSLYLPLYKHWSRNVSPSKKFPKYEPISDLVYGTGGKRTYDFRLVTNHDKTDDVFFYVTKYVLKYDSYNDRLKSAIKLNFSEEEARDYWKTLRPCFQVSKGFGSCMANEEVHKYVRKCVDMSSEQALFYSPVNGKSSPLSPYLQKQIFTTDDKEKFRPQPVLNDFGELITPKSYYSIPSIESVVEKVRSIRDINTKYERMCEKLRQKNPEL